MLCECCHIFNELIEYQYAYKESSRDQKPLVYLEITIAVLVREVANALRDGYVRGSEQLHRAHRRHT